MKIFDPFDLQTKECVTIPNTKFEAEELKSKSFNEGWWKGYAVAAIGSISGFIIGEIVANKILKK